MTPTYIDSGVGAALDDAIAALKQARESIDTHAQAYIDSATDAEATHATQDVAAMRKCLEDELELYVLRSAQIAALTEYKSVYRCRADPDSLPTDFAKELRDRTAAVLEATRRDKTLAVRCEDKRARFERNVWMVNHQGQAMPGEEDDDVILGDDGEFLGGKYVNDTCPISGKAILSMDQPVHDHKNVVYESAAIRALIKAEEAKRRECRCPLAGTTHIVREQDLLLAQDIVRLIKAGKGKGGKGWGGAAGGSNKRKAVARVVIDDEGEGDSD